jgi:hypothetical protein
VGDFILIEALVNDSNNDNRDMESGPNATLQIETFPNYKEDEEVFIDEFGPHNALKAQITLQNFLK